MADGGSYYFDFLEFLEFLDFYDYECYDFSSSFLLIAFPKANSVLLTIFSLGSLSLVTLWFDLCLVDFRWLFLLTLDLAEGDRCKGVSETPGTWSWLPIYDPSFASFSSYFVSI